MKLLFALSMLAAAALGGSTVHNGLPTLPKYPSVLQLSARPWLYELSQSRGKTIRAFRDIPDDVFTQIKTLGFDMVWMMGVWSVGPYGVKHDRTDAGLVQGFKSLLPDYTEADVIGSPYAITNYTCNPELCPSGDSDLVWLRKRLNNLGIRLMLDFVPNHSALDSPWIESNIDYYIRAPQGTSDPARYFTNGVAFGNMQYSSAWTDVGQLNYWNPALRKHMTEQLIKVASFADGIRCDMAYIILNDPFQAQWSTELNAWGWSRPSDEFWTSAIKAAKAAYPGTVFLAEVYGDYFIPLQQQGFDFTYDKEMLDRLVNGHLDNLRGWISYMTPYQDHVCRFLENHDDNRAVERFGSVTRTDAAALVAYTLPGLRFFFQDQWHGLTKKLDVHLRRSASEAYSDEAYQFYLKLKNILSSPVFRDGTWTNLQVSGGDSWRLVAWSWANKETGEKRLVVVNYSDVLAGGSVKVSDVSGSGTVKITELLSGVTYDRNAEEMRSTGLNVVINQYSGQIFSYY